MMKFASYMHLSNVFHVYSCQVCMAVFHQIMIISFLLQNITISNSCCSIYLELVQILYYTVYTEQNYLDCDLDREILSCVNTCSGSRNKVVCDVRMTEK